MGLVELGKHTGLSPAMLSKLERGKLFRTLPTLMRIAMVFGVGLEHFFTRVPQPIAPFAKAGIVYVRWQFLQLTCILLIRPTSHLRVVCTIWDLLPTMNRVHPSRETCL